MSRCIDLDDHVVRQRNENARWLMSEGGLDLSGAAARLGVEVETLEKSLNREKEKAHEPG